MLNKIQISSVFVHVKDNASCMRLRDHVTVNVKKRMSTPAVFFGCRISFWHNLAPWVTV